MNTKILNFFILLIFMSVTTYGQRGIKRTDKFQNYKDTNKEFAYTLNASYLRYEGNWSPQIQLQYTKFITPFFGLGLGYGGIIDSQFHNTFSFDVTIKAHQNLSFVFKPGVQMKNNRGKTNFLYSFGFAGTYQHYIAEKTYIGPSVQFDLIQDDLNFMGGIITGFRF